MNIQFEQQSLRVNSIFCVGRNYVAHIEELKNEKPSEPLIFLKPNQALQCEQSIILPAYSQNIHYEAELVLLIGKDCDALNPESALDAVLGYGVGLDLTARDIQDEIKKKGLPWTKAKAFKQSACVSVFKDKKHFPQEALYFSLHINQTLKQQGDTRYMIFNIPYLLCYLAQHYGLRAGDLIFTGTPEGVGALHSGDTLHLDLNGIIQAEFKIA